MQQRQFSTCNHVLGGNQEEVIRFRADGLRAMGCGGALAPSLSLSSMRSDSCVGLPAAGLLIGEGPAAGDASSMGSGATEGVAATC